MKLLVIKNCYDCPCFSSNEQEKRKVWKEGKDLKYENRCNHKKAPHIITNMQTRVSHKCPIPDMQYETNFLNTLLPRLEQQIKISLKKMYNTPQHITCHKVWLDGLTVEPITVERQTKHYVWVKSNRIKRSTPLFEILDTPEEAQNLLSKLKNQRK